MTMFAHPEPPPHWMPMFAVFFLIVLATLLTVMVTYLLVTRPRDHSGLGCEPTDREAFLPRAD